MDKALGLIEAQGLTTAVTALDAASKAADIVFIGVEKVIGVEKGVGVTINIAGEVAAVKAAIEAGVIAGNRVGRVVSSHVIPRPHDEIDKLIEKFANNLKKEEKIPAKPAEEGNKE
ncbi:BMC domain-containing protein [Tissierella creatinini]|nr:BMC domain-containing protein [Tissierella creatinini]TJX63917.1 BMC domain-containing protein [Soehngenia saccharolytica]